MQLKIEYNKKNLNNEKLDALVVFIAEDTDILEMWNKAIAEMSADGTTATITKKWFGRDVSL